MSAQDGGEIVPGQRYGGALLYIKYHRRHHVRLRGHDSGKKVWGHHYGVPQCRAAAGAAHQTGAGSPCPSAAGEDRHARESAPFLSLCHAPEFHYHDISGGGSAPRRLYL